MNSAERRQARYLRRKKKRDDKRRKRIEPYDNYDNVFTFKHLWKSYKKCVCGVGWKTSTQKYRNRPISNISQAYIKLKNGTYKSKGFYCFSVCDRGKQRDIKSVHISERVVQRCLCDFSLIPVFMSQLIYDNGACMKGKGIDFAKDRTECHLQRYYRREGTNEGYALVFDFSKYFDGIAHEMLDVIIRKEFTDSRIIFIYMHFVDMFGSVGLGLGSQISQISAIRYPSEIDYAVKQQLLIKAYERYMDDGFLVHRSKERLKECLVVIKSLCDKYSIKLNRKKTQIVSLRRGLPFLKLRFILTKDGKVIRIPQKKGVRQSRKKIRAYARLVAAGRMTYEDAQNSLIAMTAHLRRSNATNAIKSLEQLFDKLIKKPKGDDDYGYC